MHGPLNVKYETLVCLFKGLRLKTAIISLESSHPVSLFNYPILLKFKYFPA
jgi:hypothetical protein